jgi:enamine deaminase RidA (YjgF/YER057c/UK114 family)
MSLIENKLKDLNIVLPEPKAPVGAYVATKITGNLLFISGQVSIDKDNNLIKGKVGKELNLEQGYKAAERCGLNLIAHVKKACNGDLEKIKTCIKLTGYVNSTDSFIDQPKVINGASDIISKILDKKGEHTRAAVSVNSLPLGVAVEVDGIFELS